MASLKETAAFMSIMLGSLVLFISFGGLELAGTQASNVVCDVPGISSTSYCSTNVEQDSTYKITSNLVVGNAGIDDTSGFKYKTSKEDPGFLSFASRPDLSVVGANDVTVEYIVKRDNQVVATDKKRLGNIAVEDGPKDVTFTTPNHPEGTYKLVYIATYEQCSLLGSIVGDCEDQRDKVSKTVNVPKLPLGEY